MNDNEQRGNRIPDSYLKRFLPSRDQPKPEGDQLPDDIARFVEDI